VLENPAFSGVLALGAAFVFAAFLAIERRARDPILPFSVFETQAYTRGVIALTGMTFAVHGTLAFTPLFLQAVLGLSPSESGAAVIAQVVGMVLCSTIVTRSSAVSERLKGVTLFGVALETLGIAGFAASALFSGGVEIFLFFLFVRGVGMGASIPILTTLVQNAAPPASLGVATSTMMFVRSFGGVIGVTVTGLILALVAGSTPAGDTPIYHAAIGSAFALHALMMTASWLLILTLPSSPTPLPPPQRTGEASPTDPLP
jgi:MFS family permease